MTPLISNDLTVKPFQTISNPEKWFFLEQNTSETSIIKPLEATPQTTITIPGESHPEKKENLSDTTIPSLLQSNSLQPNSLFPATTNTPQNQEDERLLSSYEIEKRTHYAPGRPITAVLSLQAFLLFLKQNTLRFIEFTKDRITALENHLFSLHDPQSLPYSSLWVWQNILGVKSFYTWLVEKKEIPLNPLEAFTQGNTPPRYQQHHEQRRQAWQKERLGKYPDPKLLSLFEEHIQAYYLGQANRIRVVRAVIHFAKFVQEIGKRFHQLEEEDFQEFLKRHSHHEVFASLQISLETFLAHTFAVRLFYRWLHEYGYHREHLLWHWNRVSLIRFWKTQESKKKNSPQNRYYNASELLRAYSLYLKKHYSDYTHHFHATTSLKFYLSFLAGRKKTVYSAEESVLEAFKKHLLEYEYAPGRYFKASFQASRLNRIKRFYDWFTCQGYGNNHPLKTFRTKEYARQIEPLCSQRKSSYTFKPEDIQEAFREPYQGFLEYEKRRGYCGSTLQRRARGVRVFFGYLYKIAVNDLKEVNEQHLNEYQNYLTHFEHTQGVPITVNTRISILVALKMFFHYLARFMYLPRDPSQCIDLPRNPKGLPTSGMTDWEFRKLIEKVGETRKEHPLRDAAMLEALYSTGLRSNELRTLKVQDIDLHAGLVRVNTPKGGLAFQRVVPIGKTACHWINRYIKEERSLGKDLKTDVLFLSKTGRPITTGLLLGIVKSYHLKTGNRKHIVTHSMRVTCATEMLRNKANIKYVQEQLGHRCMESTGKYLRLMPTDLKEVHNKCHPREKRPQAPFLFFHKKKSTETKHLKN